MKILSGLPLPDETLRPRAIQHPAPVDYIGQFDTQSNAH